MRTYFAIAFAILVVALGVILPRATEQPLPAANTNEPSPVTAPPATLPENGPQTSPATAGAPSATPDAAPEVTRTPSEQAPPAMPPPNVSAAVQEVVAMVRGGVDSSVVDSYIKNSGSQLPPSVHEILYLNSQKVPKEIITSMIQRGADQKASDARAAKESAEQARKAEADRLAAAVKPAPPAPAPPPAPTVVATPSPAYYFAPTMPVVVNTMAYAPPVSPYAYYPSTPGVVFFSFGPSSYRNRFPRNHPPGNSTTVHTSFPPNSPSSFKFIEPFRLIRQ